MTEPSEHDFTRTFFTTATTLNRRPVFLTEPNSRLLLNTLFACRDRGLFRLHEFVVMPDHVHLLLTPQSGLSVQEAVQQFKDTYCHAFREEFDSRMEIWEQTCAHRQIRDWADFQKCRRFIYQNPVHAGFVQRPEDYPCCSAYPGFCVDLLCPSGDAGRDPIPSLASAQGSADVRS